MNRLNESFTTIPIVYNPNDVIDFANDIKQALLKLPNQVINDIHVIAQRIWGNYEVLVNISFSGSSVQGNQNLLQVKDYYCDSGCTPLLTGLTLETRLNYRSSNITEYQVADIESYECGRRGKCDYSTGLCQCFLGYTGDNCNTMTTLV